MISFFSFTINVLNVLPNFCLFSDKLRIAKMHVQHIQKDNSKNEPIVECPPWLALLLACRYIFTII